MPRACDIRDEDLRARARVLQSREGQQAVAPELAISVITRYRKALPDFHRPT